jgi:CheY-like chemotaxis protein
MKVESVEGVGTSFVIRFPASAAAPATEETVEAPCQAQADGRALVIDDEPDVGELIAEILKREGFHVDISVTGADALERLSGDPYDIILSDLRMPGFNGRDLYQQLHDDKPDLLDRLGFITGDTVSPKARNFLKATGRPFLEKPISPKDVRRLLAKMTATGST